jgi:hypothetical protein
MTRYPDHTPSPNGHNRVLRAFREGQQLLDQIVSAPRRNTVEDVVYAITKLDAAEREDLLSQLHRMFQREPCGEYAVVDQLTIDLLRLRLRQERDRVAELTQPKTRAHVQQQVEEASQLKAQGKTWPEIAKVQNISPETARKRDYRRRNRKGKPGPDRKG